MYIDGFVIAVPNAAREDYANHAGQFDEWLIEHGAVRVTECWGDDIPEGKLTDFRRAVLATPEESVVFSWVEWPDKATRDAAMAAMMDPAADDPRIDQQRNPPPFDGRRMIMGGFTPLITLAR